MVLTVFKIALSEILSRIQKAAGGDRTHPRLISSRPVDQPFIGMTRTRMTFSMARSRSITLRGTSCSTTSIT